MRLASVDLWYLMQIYQIVVKARPSTRQHECVLILICSLSYHQVVSVPLIIIVILIFKL